MDRDRILIFDSQWDIGGLHPSSVCWSTIIEGVEVRIYTEGRVSELEELVVDGVAEPHSHIFTSGEHTLVVKTQNSGESVRVFTYRFTPKKKWAGDMVLKPGKPVTFDIRKLTGNDTANIWGYAIIPDVEFRTKNHYLHLLIEGESYIWRWAIGNYEGYGPGRPTITFELSSDSYMRSDEEFRAELRL